MRRSELTNNNVNRFVIATFISLFYIFSFVSIYSTVLILVEVAFSVIGNTFVDNNIIRDDRCI